MYPNEGFEYRQHEKYSLDEYLKQSRLIMSFVDKSEYVIHHEELAFYLSHGMIVDSISYGYKFEQDDFMSGFFDHVLQHRRSCTLETVKALIKWILNSIYGMQSKILFLELQLISVFNRKIY